MKDLKNILTVSFDKVFLILGVTLEIIIWWITDDSLLSGLSGVLGMIAVILCSQRKLIQYLFSFLQLFTYLILSLKAHLWGEVGENVFYFLTMIIGFFIWKKNTNSGETKTRELNKWPSRIISLGCALGVIILWKILSETNDPRPFLDSISTVPAIIAQFLLILRYRESWIYWGIIDIASIFMWLSLGNWCMVIQFIFWTINCVYGWIMWKNK